MDASLNTGGMFSEGFGKKKGRSSMKKTGYGGKGLPKGGKKKGKSCRKKK